MSHKVTVAKTAGFCFGVERAVNTVYEEIKKGGSIYTYGDIIHNEIVVEDLKGKGVTVLNSLQELKDLESGTVIIRSHGTAKEVYELIASKKELKIVDATCPFVKKIHGIVEKECAAGRYIIIAGDKDHPEVEGILSYAGDRVSIINSEEEAYKLSLDTDIEICMVAQTTFNLGKFQKLVEILREKRYSIYDVNTVCSATRDRQEEAKALSSVSDVMIVIGSKKSSNTRKLYDICREGCADTHLIQTLDDLNLDAAKSFSCVGITAGASTPKTIIEEVQNYVRGTEF